MQVDPKLTAQIEPFDTFWEAPANIEKGYGTFGKFYERNYLKHMDIKTGDRVLVVSCGPGYFVDLLMKRGVDNVIGIDSDPDKVAYARARRLDCRVANAFGFLEEHPEHYDVIFAEQELNHLTKPEILQFLSLCRHSLRAGGLLAVHSLNGANPVTGSEALAQNFDHYNTMTEYSLRQVLAHSGFRNISVFPLNLYIFYENPANYVGMFLDSVIQMVLRISFKFYGKTNRIFTKKIAAVCRK